MIEEKIQRNIVLAPYTTFKIGGSAKFFVEIKTKEELIEAVDWAKKEKEPIYYLGGGSNILIADEGLPGLVIKLGNKDVDNLSPRLYCGAGASLAYTISLARGANLSGLEWGFGIPMATIGGSVRGNAGGFGQTIGEAIEIVEAYNIKKNRFENYSQGDCQFGYRASIFKKDNNLLIWSATLKLRPAGADEISVLIENNSAKRFATQPKLPSAGSVFKNLFFEEVLHANSSFAQFLREQNRIKNEKVAVGFLIEHLGLKGHNVGGAKISLEHANFIVNTGGAKASEVLELIRFVKCAVKEKLNIDLETEIEIIK